MYPGGGGGRLKNMFHLIHKKDCKCPRKSEVGPPTQLVEALLKTEFQNGDNQALNPRAPWDGTGHTPMKPHGLSMFTKCK